MTMLPRRRFAYQLVSLPVAALAFPALVRADESNLREGKVFASTNAVAGNEVMAFAPNPNGNLGLVARVATQGQGTGAALGSQGAVTISNSGRFLFVVNASSSTVSTFEITPDRLRLVSVVGSGGLQPVSVAEYNGLVYVLNAGGAGNVAGFRNMRGELSPLSDGLRGLSASGGTGPAQVSFSSDGDALVVTEKATNRISSYPVRHDGSLGAIVITPSSGATPFGFAFDQRNRMIVSEAPTSSASSYCFDSRAPATPILISPSVPNGEVAACWVVIAPSGRIAYTANAGTSSISSYRILPSGQIELVSAVAGSNGSGAGALDLAISTGGRRLYCLAPRSLQIIAFSVEPEGDLIPLGAATGLPVGCVGLAAN